MPPQLNICGFLFDPGYHVLGDAPGQSSRGHGTGGLVPYRLGVGLREQASEDQGEASAWSRQERGVAGESTLWYVSYFEVRPLSFVSWISCLHQIKSGGAKGQLITYGVLTTAPSPSGGKSWYCFFSLDVSM